MHTSTICDDRLTPCVVYCAQLLTSSESLRLTCCVVVLAVGASCGERAAVRGVWRALQLLTGRDVTSGAGVPPCNSQLVTALLRSYRASISPACT